MRYRSARLVAGAQLLACSLVLAGAPFAPPALAQADGNRTCRAALGENFTVSSGFQQQRCCMVVAEKAWYVAKGVVLGKVYLTEDNRKVRPRHCSPTASAPTGASETPGSLMTPGDGAPPRKEHVYY